MAAAGCTMKPRRLNLDSGRDAWLYVPAAADGRRAAPLIVAFHGAGGSGQRFVHRFIDTADQSGTIVLAPDSRRDTWDFRERGAEDSSFVQRALREILGKHRVDPAHLAAAGYSDGATYALTFGLTNGALVSHVIAFSAGGLVVQSASPEKPKVFLSHGTDDDILPIERCGRPIAAALRQRGYAVTWREFSGTHALPDSIVREAMTWFAA